MTTRISNVQYLTVLPPFGLDGVGWAVRVLSERDYSTLIADIPWFAGLGFTVEANAEGGATVTLDSDDSVFTSPLPVDETTRIVDQEALWQILEDGQVRFEFLAEDVDEDVVTESGARATVIAGRGTGSVLEWAPVFPEGMPAPTTMSRTFNAHPMAAWHALFLEAQAEGFLEWVTPTFSATEDSHGVPWGPAQTLTVNAGDTLLDLLKRWAEVNELSWRMLPGFRLEVKQTGGLHHEDTVVFTQYRSQGEHKRKITRRELANVVYADSGDNGIAVAEDGDSVTKWRKRAAWVSAGDAGDPSARSMVANTSLGLSKDQRLSRTVRIIPDKIGRQPFVDFDVNDWIGLEVPDDDTESGARLVVGLAVDIDADGAVEFEATLSSRFEVRAVKLKRLMDKLGGSERSGSGSDTASPIPVSRVLSTMDLAGLADVDLTAPASGSLLQWNGSRWIDVVGNLDLLADVVTTGASAPTDGQALVYQSSSGLWKPGTVASGGGGGGGTVVVPTIRATNSNAGSGGTTASVVVPATAVAGDLLVLFVGGDWQPSSTTLAGWTYVGGATGSNTNDAVWTKACVAGDIGATVNITMAGSGGWDVYCTAVQDGKLVRSSQLQQGSSGTTVQMTNTTAPIDANDIVLMFGHARIGTKTVTWDVGTAVHSRTADSSVSSTLWKTTGVTSLRPTVSNTALASTGGYALAVLAIAPAQTGLLTTRFEAPYPGTSVSLSGDTELSKGNRFFVMGDATITNATVYANAVAGKTYKLQCWELASNMTTLAAQIGSTVNVPSPGTVANSGISSGLVAWPVSAGKWYVVTISATDNTTVGTYYGGSGAIGPLMMDPPGQSSYMRLNSGTLAVGNVLTLVGGVGQMQTVISAVSR